MIFSDFPCFGSSNGANSVSVDMSDLIVTRFGNDEHFRPVRFQKCSSGHRRRVTGVNSLRKVFPTMVIKKTRKVMVSNILTVSDLIVTSGDTVLTVLTPLTPFAALPESGC